MNIIRRSTESGGNPPINIVYEVAFRLPDGQHEDASGEMNGIPAGARHYAV